jgi:hypothetical protein
MTDVQEPKKRQQRSLDWVLKSASRILLGQFSIPGWFGFLFAIFWDVPGWQSKFDFWAKVAQSSNGWLTPLADILLWPYFSPTLGIISFVYLIVVSRFGETGTARSTVVTSLAWISVAAIFIAFILVTGYGAGEFYIRTQIAKGIAGVPRDSSPASSEQNGTDRALYSDGPRSLTQNQQRLLIGMGEKLRDQIPKLFLITYMATDMEAFSYASQLRTTFEHAAIQTAGPQEQPLPKAGVSGLIILADDVKSPAAIALQQALETLDIHPQLAADLSRPGNYPLVLFVGPRPVRP